MKLEVISRYPTESGHPTPLLFIHGMLHGAWCWDANFLDYFARHGYAAHAVNLRGHGNSEGRENLRWTRIAEYVDDVSSVVQQLPRPPILIGHSMGGFIIRKYLEDHAAPGAVLLSSPTKLLAPALRVARRHPLLFARATLTLSQLPLISTPQLAREAFFGSDVPEDQMVTYWKRMQDGSYRAYLDMVGLDPPRPARDDVPMLVLGAGGDNMLTPGDVEATARACGAPFEIIPDVAHNSMLGPRWQAVAERILTWLQQRD
jgi:pimeloyl-ACP methyl ester carboxylesterase